MLRGILRKYNYLLRLVLTICLALAIPFLMMSYFVVHRTYNEIDTKNKAYYHEAIYYFSYYFDEQISMFLNNAVNLSIDRKILRENIDGDAWNTIDAVTKILPDYKTGVPFAKMMGIYFKGTDYVLTSGYKYDLDYFINLYTGKSPALYNEFEAFFKSVHKSRTFLFSNFNEMTHNEASLFVGIQVSIESNIGYDALVFYVLDCEYFETSFSRGYSSKYNGLCIFDETGRIIYTNGNFRYDIPDCAQFKDFLFDKSIVTLEYTLDSALYDSSDNVSTSTSYSIFKWYNDDMKLFFVSIIPQEDVMKNVRDFYNIIHGTLIITIITTLILLIISVYVNYQPVLRLVRRIKSSNGDEHGLIGELKSIENAFNKINDKNEIMLEMVSEQRMLLMDYILGNLLDGKPIPESKIDYLGINLKGEKFCVITILGLKLNNLQKAGISDQVHKKSGIKVYITDIPYEKHIVFICIIDSKSNIRELVEFIEESLVEYSTEYKISVGNTVDGINNIRNSYLNSLSALEAHEKIIFFDDLPDCDSNSVLNKRYPSAGILEFLQYVKNGEEESAISTLSNILSCASKNVFSNKIEQYICYDVLSSYINILKHFDINLEDHEIETILNFNSTSELYELMSESVKEVCRSICERKQFINETYRKSIIEYVDQNFNDPDISLIKVADMFNISIYTFSRLFKEMTGIGFKEYIIAKRIELSKQLLLTTDKKIKEIALDVGFSNATYFTQIFKSLNGVVPSKYR